jgi:hypothetical protein
MTDDSTREEMHKDPGVGDVPGDDVAEALVEQAVDRVAHQQAQRLGLERDRSRIVPEVLRVAEGDGRHHHVAGVARHALGDDVGDQVVAGRRVRAVLLRRAHRHDGRGSPLHRLLDLAPGHLGSAYFGRH